jgi:hypothetical protein
VRVLEVVLSLLLGVLRPVVTQMQLTVPAKSRRMTQPEHRLARYFQDNTVYTGFQECKLSA